MSASTQVVSTRISSARKRNLKRLMAGIAAVPLMSMLAPAPAPAATLFWSGDGTTEGGTGTWNTALPRWGSAAAGPFTTVWANANVDSATFENVAVATGVTVGGAITLNTLTTNVGLYTFSGASSLTFSGTGAGVNTVQLATAGATTLSAPYAGAVLTKTGVGRLELNNSSSTVSKYVINGGILGVAAFNRFGTASTTGALVQDFLTINGGGLGNDTTSSTLEVSRGITVGASGAFFGSSSASLVTTLPSKITGTAGGGLVFTNANVFTGSAFNQGGTWILSSTGNDWNGAMTVITGCTVKLGASEVIPNAAQVTLSGTTATLNLNGNNETVGFLTSNGTLALGANTLTTTGSAGTSFFNGNDISGTGGITVASGQQNLSTNFSYTGPTTINGGILEVDSLKDAGTNSSLGASTIANPASNLVLNGGTLRYQRVQTTGTNGNTVAFNRNYTLGTSGGTFDPEVTGTLTGNITFSGNMTAIGTVGTQTLTLAGTSTGSAITGTINDGTGSNKTALLKTGAGTWTINNIGNTYTGATTVTTGTLVVGGVGAIPSGSNVTVNGGTLTVNAADTVNGVVLSSGTIAGSAALTSATDFDVRGGTASAVLSGAVGLNKTTSGTATITGTNNYTGNTTISLGTVSINTTVTTPFGSLGTLRLSGGTLSTSGSRNATSAPLVNSLDVTADSAIATTGTANPVDLNFTGATITGAAGTTLTIRNDSTSGSGLFTPRFAAGFNYAGNIAIVNGSFGTSQFSSFNTTGNDQTFSGLISGTGSFRRSATTSGTGGNSIFLSANNYSGGTSLNDGGLGFGVDSVGATGPIGTGTLTVGGTKGSVFAVGGARMVSNPITFNSTPLVISGSNDLNLTGTVALGSSARTIQVDNSAGSTLSGVVSGTGGLTKTGNGVLTISGANNYTGTTTVTAGTLQTAVDSTIPSGGAVTVNGGTLDLTTTNQSVGVVTLTSGSINGTTGVLTATSYAAQGGSASAILSGNTAALTKTTAGTTTLSGANNYGGGTNVNVGTLAAGAANTLPSGGAVTVGGGTLDIADKNQTVGAVVMTGGNINGMTGVLTASSYDMQNGSASAILAGAGALSKNGAGSVTISGANNYSGGTNVNLGTLTAGAPNTLPSGGAVTVVGGALNIVDKNQSVGVVQLTGGAINGTTGIVTATSYDLQSGSASAILAGTGVSATKSTGGTVTLTAANTYDGGTTISAGTLLVNNTTGSGTGTGAVTVSGAGTLGGSGTISGAITVSSGGTIAPGNSLGTLTVGTLILSSCSAGSFELGLTSDQVVVTDPSTLTTGLGLDSGTNTTTINLAAAPGFAPGTFSIIDYGTAYTGNLASLVLGTVPVGLDYAIMDNGANKTIDVVVTAQSRTWIKDADGNWSVGANWGATASQPNGVGATANLVATTPTNPDQVVTLDDGNKTVGALNLTNSSRYTIVGTGSNKLIIDTFGGNGTITDSLGSHTISAGVQLNKDVDVTVTNPADTLSISGNITGAAKVVSKLGNGTLLLTGNNTYSGGTTVSAGTLQGDTNGVQGNILNNAAVVFDQSSNGNYTGVMSGSGTLTKQGSGIVTLSGANNYGGGTLITAGSLRAGAVNTLPSAGAVTVSGTGSLDIVDKNQTVGAVVLMAGSIDGTTGVLTGSSYDVQSGSISANLSGATSALTKSTAGTVIMTGVNNYGGGTTVSGGTLQGDSGSLQGAIQNDASVVFAQAANGTYAGNMTGTGSLTKTLAGTLALTGTNNYSGGTTVSAGAIKGAPGTAIQGNIANNGEVIFDAAGTYADVMSGTGVLTKSGAGTLILTGANNYSGGTTVSAGTLQGDSNSVQGSIANSASVVFDQGSNGTYAGNMSGTGSLSKLGAGILAMTGTNNYGGGTTVSVGAIQGAPGTAIQGNITNNAEVIFDAAGTYADVMSGTGVLTKSGTGTTILTGANNYSGGTTVSAGTLQGDTTSLQGAINNNASVTFAQAADGVYAGNMTGTGSLTKTLAGTLSLTGANSYVGGTTVSAGAIKGAPGTAIQGAINNNAEVIFDAAGTYGDVMSGSGVLTKSGTGTSVITGANNYIGGTNVSAGTLAAGAAGTLPSGGAVTVSGGSLDIAGNSQTAGAVTLSGGSIDGTTGVLTANSHDVRNGSVSAILGGATAALTKTTAGTVTLTGANTYGGGTNVNGGTLAADATNTLPSGGAVSVAGGTLDIADKDQSVGAVIVDSAGAINGTTGILTATSYDMRNGSVSAILNGSAALTKTTAGTVTLSGINTYSGANNLNGGVLSVGSSSNLGDASATNGIVFDGGALTATGGLASAARNITVNAGGGTINSGAFNSTFGNVSGIGTLTKNDSGNLTVNHVRTNGLTVAGGKVTVAANGGAAGTSVVTNLSIAGQVDLQDNHLAVTNGTLGTFTGSYDGVTGMIAAGRNGGTWDGNGLITGQSNALAAQNYLTSLAVAKASDAKGITTGQTAMFGGQTVADTDVLVMYTYTGDADLSGAVNADDYFLIDSNYNKSGTTDGWYHGDFNYDGQINGDDYFAIDNSYMGQGSPLLPGGLPGGVSAVPEPTSLTVLGLGAMLLGRRSRRRAR